MIATIEGEFLSTRQGKDDKDREWQYSNILAGDEVIRVYGYNPGAAAKRLDKVTVRIEQRQGREGKFQIWGELVIGGAINPGIQRLFKRNFPDYGEVLSPTLTHAANAKIQGGTIQLEIPFAEGPYCVVLGAGRVYRIRVAYLRGGAQSSNGGAFTAIPSNAMTLMNGWQASEVSVTDG
jgi:hypothetical protein